MFKSVIDFILKMIIQLSVMYMHSFTEIF